MRDDDSAFVLGMDIGGTSSRALVSDLTGRVLGTGAAAGGNPNSHPADEAVRQIAAAATQALHGIDPGAVRGCVIGMAGVSKMTDPAFQECFDEQWARLGLRCARQAIGDCEVAFAAGTPATDGTVVIAGTGSVATRIEGHQLAATAGGYGWLLGDDGSAFWLGREAVRATLAALDRGSTPTGLTAAVPRRLLPDAEPQRRKLISAVTAQPPIRLAELAPLVTDAAKEADPTATAIVDRAACLLADTVAGTRPSLTEPVVLGGGLLVPGNPVGDALRAELTERGHAHLHTAGPGAAGAAWLAALPLSRDPEALHKTLLG